MKCIENKIKYEEERIREDNSKNVKERKGEYCKKDDRESERGYRE